MPPDWGFAENFSKFSREYFLFFYKVDNNTPLRVLSPTLFYFLKVVSGEFACFRGGGLLRKRGGLEAPRGGYMLPQANIAGGGNFHGIGFCRNREKVSEGGPLSKFEGGGTPPVILRGGGHIKQGGVNGGKPHQQGGCR